jgi:hypothetical protein
MQVLDGVGRKKAAPKAAQKQKRADSRSSEVLLHFLGRQRRMRK